MDVVTYAALQKKIKESTGEIKIPTEVSAFSNDAGYQTAGQVSSAIAERIVTALDATSTDSSLPSAKLVYELLAGLRLVVGTSLPSVDDRSVLTIVTGG